MKLKLLCYFLVTVMILSLLTSCSPAAVLEKLEESERADMIYDITNAVYTDSYLVRLDSEMSGILDGMKMEMRITGDSYYIGMSSDSPIMHFETNVETEVFLSGTSATSRMRMREGYRDGKMYIQNAVSSSLYSNITAEDYIAYISEGSSALNEKIALAHKNAATKTCTRKEDGGWLASFSDFPEEELSLLISAYFNSSVLMLEKASVTGMTVEIDTSKSLKLREIRYILQFEGDASAVTTLKILDADAESLPQINLHKFHEIPDLRIIDMIKNKLLEKINSGSGMVTMSNTVSINNQGNNKSTLTDAEISYSNGESGLTFDYRYENPAVPDVFSELNYRDGKLISGSDASGTVSDSSMSELEARSYLLSLIDAGDLMNALISDVIIEENNPNKYIFLIESPSITKYYSTVGYFPLEAIDSSARLTVTLKDGEISEYTYSMTIKANYSGRRVSVFQSNKRTFE